METMLLKRDRLLRRIARASAAAGLVTALLVACTPPLLGSIAFWAAIPFFAAAAFAIWRLDSPHPLRMLVGAWAGELAIILVIVGTGQLDSIAATITITTLLVASLSGAGMLLLGTIPGTFAYWLLGAVAALLANLLLTTVPGWLPPAVLALLGWAVMHVIGVLLAGSIPYVLRRIAEIGAIHVAERQASERESQRRHSARLLHDTVLATLTLLAHSGIGVPADALRAQARNDAELLRALRLGAAVPSTPSPSEPVAVEESTIGTTLESVRDRFEALSLTIQWHGATRIALPQAVLDAFLFAMSECLENVRRHSGVTTAHVTVTEDERMVRAMITDAGRGFQPDDVDGARLGLKDSVMGRLSDVRGSAKVFSAPGAGTTVLLEVPR